MSIIEKYERCDDERSECHQPAAKSAKNYQCTPWIPCGGSDDIDRPDRERRGRSEESNDLNGPSYGPSLNLLEFGAKSLDLLSAIFNRSPDAQGSHAQLALAQALLAKRPREFGCARDHSHGDFSFAYRLVVSANEPESGGTPEVKNCRLRDRASQPSVRKG